LRAQEPAYDNEAVPLQHRLIRRAALAAIVVGIVAVAAGCGGSSSSPEEEWAGSVCSDVTTWKDQVQKSVDSVKQQLQAPQSGMLTSIKADINSAVDATTTLATNLTALDPPDTDEGKQAQQQIDSLATQLKKTVNTVKSTVAGLPQGASASQVVQALVPLAPSLQSLATSASTALASVQAHGDSLKQGFQDADACKPYRK
jgi:hypothetical protein